MNAVSPSFKPAPNLAFSLMELFIAVAFLAILAAVFLPGLAKSKARSSRLNCNNNMRMIGLAFHTWSLDNHDHFPMQVPRIEGGTMELAATGDVFLHFQVMSNELSTPRILLCPTDDKRLYATSFDAFADTNLSYFISISTTKGDNANFLFGDRNLTNRARPGNRLISLTKLNSIAWTRDLHYEKGNLGFGDASVTAFRNGDVGTVIKSLGATTNWLAVP